MTESTAYSPERIRAANVLGRVLDDAIRRLEGEVASGEQDVERRRREVDERRRTYESARAMLAEHEQRLAWVVEQLVVARERRAEELAIALSEPDEDDMA